ncbi:MAG: tyrosine-type recombinase/integrase [Spirochaetales bacterium]|nr:tyrosine-type recombinase/integrase [Spirochaetales bacterium]
MKQEFSLWKRKTAKGKPVYYALVYEKNGKRKAYSLGTGRKREAERLAAEKWGAAGVSASDKKTATVREFSVDFFLPGGKWFTDRRAIGKGVSERTAREKQRTLENRILPYLGGRRIVDLGTYEIERWRNELLNDLSGASVNKAIECLRAVLYEAAKRGIIQTPPEIERAGYSAKARGVLSGEEFRRVMFGGAWDDRKAWAANLAAAMTAARQGEILALRRRSLRVPGFIIIEQSFNQATRQLNKSTKTGKTRRVPCSDRLHDTLVTLLEANPEPEGPEQFIFWGEGPEGGSVPMDGKRLLSALHEAMDAAGIDWKGRNINFHSWRHFANSLFINSNLPLQAVQAVTGHVTDAMTANYFHTDDTNFSAVTAIQDDLLITDSPIPSNKENI